MIRFLEADFNIMLNKWKSFLIYLIVIVFMVHMMLKYEYLSGDMIFDVFNAITVFFLIMNFIFIKGELFEKKIIRYYLENERNRIKILLFFYMEGIFVYIVFVSIFLMFLFMLKYYVSFKYVVLYFFIYVLYLVITMNIILYFNKVGTCVIVTIILFWILPNIVNFLCIKYNFYDFQIFYYLSNETFIKTSFDIKKIIISLIYTIFISMISLVYFDKMEI